MQVKDGKIGFQMVKEGWHSFEVQSEIDFRKGRDKEGKELEEVTNTLVIPVAVIEDEDEGVVLRIACNLDKNIGKQWLATVLLFSGLSAKIAKKKKWPDLDADNAGDYWKDELFDPDSKLVQDVIMTKLPGNKLDGKVVNREGREKREDGTFPTFQNVIEVKRYGEGEKETKDDTSTDKEETGGDAKKKKEEKNIEVEDWV